MTTLATILAVVFGIILLMILGMIFSRKRPETRAKFSLYTQALNHILQGHNETAIKELKSIIEKDTNHIDAYIKLGNLLRKTGKLKAAIKVHQALLYRQDINKYQKLEIMRNLVLDYVELNEKGIALSVALNILDEDKKNIWALEKIWHLYRDLKKWSKASDYLEKVQQVKKESNRRILAIYKVQEGLEKLASGENHDARMIFRKAIKIDPKCEAPYYYYAKSYLNDNRESDAVEWWEKFAEVAPTKSWLVFHDLQKVLFNFGNFSKIEDFYLNILKKAPGDVRTITALANFYERKGDLKQALNLISDLIVTNPTSVISKIAYSKILIALNRNREASDILNDILYKFDTTGEVRCSNCGHIVTEALWICPICGKEDSFLD